MMIISASYKTDIPAFYPEWLMTRIREGCCSVTNPYNKNLIQRVSLRREDVDGFVFWTKNFAPMMQHLKEVRDRGFPFIVQYSINNYPKDLEFSVVNSERSVSHIRTLADTYAPGVAVWRYDPIVITSLTPPDFHMRNFQSLAESLEGATDEVIVSFAQIYRKTLRNMNSAAKEFGFSWCDPKTEEKVLLLRELSNIAASHGLRLTVCSQPEYSVSGVAESRCIDAPRLMRVWGKTFQSKIKGNRPGCMCAESKDIGDYDTCPHGCVYCYAVGSRELAKRRFRNHDPNGESLFPNEANRVHSESTFFEL